MLNRRLFLKGATLLGCSAAAHPMMSTVTLAAAPGENRLVVIVLRGAMDGLDVVQPYGDPLLASYRPNMATGPAGGASDLDGFYALHAGLAGLMPLWQAGELGFAHAVSTPYRDKRSHFDGQDILEAGTGPDVTPQAARDGWLNRLVQVMPGATAETAFSVGVEEMLILQGKAPTSSWAPDSQLALTPQARLLFDHIYHDDSLFRDAVAQAMDLGAETQGDGMAAGTGNTASSVALAGYAAERLRGDTRIASFSLTGWDTHRGQGPMIGKALERLQATILALKAGLGPVWAQTTVMAITEFGRTARENGSRGTDHGTGGAMLVAGGAVRGGQVLGKWPGLADSDLYDARDLMPTADVRAYAGWAMRGLFGVDRAVVEGSVFPGLDLGGDPGMLL
jgi:uncharacterized protein (DUF1501 family)